METRPPPAYLSAKAKRWFLASAQQFVFERDSEWTLLEQAAGCLDRIDQARKEITKLGLLVATGQGAWKPNPACNIERDQKTLLARLLRELRMNEPGEETRLPSIPVR